MKTIIAVLFLCSVAGSQVKTVQQSSGRGNRMNQIELWDFDQWANGVLLAECQPHDDMWKMAYRDWLAWRAMNLGIKRGDVGTQRAKVLYDIHVLQATACNPGAKPATSGKPAAEKTKQHSGRPADD